MPIFVQAQNPQQISPSFETKILIVHNYSARQPVKHINHGRHTENNSRLLVEMAQSHAQQYGLHLRNYVS